MCVSVRDIELVFRGGGLIDSRGGAHHHHHHHQGRPSAVLTPLLFLPRSFPPYIISPSTYFPSIIPLPVSSSTYCTCFFFFAYLSHSLFSSYHFSYILFLHFRCLSLSFYIIVAVLTPVFSSPFLALLQFWFVRSLPLPSSPDFSLSLLKSLCLSVSRITCSLPSLPPFPFSLKLCSHSCSSSTFRLSQPSLTRSGSSADPPRLFELEALFQLPFQLI